MRIGKRMYRSVSMVRDPRGKFAKISLIVVFGGMCLLAVALSFQKQVHDANDVKLVYAVWQDDRSRAFELLDQGVSPNLRYADSFRFTVPEYLHYLILRMDPRHRTPAVTSLGPKTPTLLIIAIGYRDTALARRLINCGADINATGYTFIRFEYNVRYVLPAYTYLETTPLIEAARLGDLDLAMALVARGANVDAATSNGDTPAHYVSIMPRSPGASRLLHALSRRSLKNRK
jgi:ankyrin repeat protein